MSKIHLRSALAAVVSVGSLGAGPALAQSCDCDIVVAAGTTSVDGDTVVRVDGTQGARAGDTVCLSAGSKAQLELRDFVGSATSPILITNCGGKVEIGTPPITSSHLGLRVRNSRYFVLSGQGDPAYTYGISVVGTHFYVNSTGGEVRYSGVSLEELSSHFTVHHLEVSGATFAGIMSKTEPRCDLTANRGNWVQRETYFHHNYIHDVHAEGFYVGHTYYTGIDKTCTTTTKLYPHTIEGVAIHDNIVERAGWDGIQLSSATQDATIHGNTIVDFGTANVGGQRQGIQVGDGTTGSVHGNLILRGKGHGIFVNGKGNNSFFNNVIVEPNEDGIYCQEGDADAGTGFYFLNNTIVSPGRHGLWMLNKAGVGNVGHNNLVAAPGRLVAGSCIKAETGVSWSTQQNTCVSTVAAAGFVDAARDDYHLLASASSLNQGVNSSSYGVTADLDGQKRPQGSAFDIGAYERTTAELFRQHFPNLQGVANYVSSAPTQGQFHDLTPEPQGGTWSINTARQLQLVRTGTGSARTDDDAGFTRYSDTATSPTLLHVSFDVGVSRWTATPFQTGAAYFSVGRYPSTSFIEYGSGGPATDTFSTLSINGRGQGKFAVAHGTTLSPDLNADGTLYRVSFFLNRSGAAASYTGPNGSTYSLGNNQVALWVGTTPVVLNAAASSTTAPLSGFRMRWPNADNGTWLIDNLVVRGALPQ